MYEAPPPRIDSGVRRRPDAKPPGTETNSDRPTARISLSLAGKKPGPGAQPQANELVLADRMGAAATGAAPPPGQVHTAWLELGSLEDIVLSS